MKTTIAVIVVVIAVVAAVFVLYTFKSPTTPVGTGSNPVSTTATFYCENNMTMKASFTANSVALTLSDARSFTLPQTVSGSGARYEATTTGSDVVFWNEGDNAFLTENDKTTYQNCTAATVATSDAPGYDTYTNLGNTFTFAFPTSFNVSGSDVGYSQGWSAEATTSGKLLAVLQVPQNYQAGTNFGDAKFTVGTSADPSAIAGCLTNPSGNGGKSSSVTIGGVQFTKLTFADAAAGNRYDTTSYRAVRSNQCYAVEYTIHYGNIQNYPTGAVKEFDEAKVQAALDEVAQSFRFTGS